MSAVGPNAQTPNGDVRREIAQRWADLKANTPHLRARDAAAQLGLSEAQLVDSRVGDGAVRLKADWPAFFAALPGLGRIMALTRNEEAVHERRGTYHQASFEGHVGLVLGPEIDLRIFLSHWRFLFALAENGRNGVMRSLQVFDARGIAVHKIYAGEATDQEAWTALVARLIMEEPMAPLAVVPHAARRGRACP